MKIGWYSMQIDPEENFVWFDTRVTNNMIIISSNSGNSACYISQKLSIASFFALHPQSCNLFDWRVLIQLICLCLRSFI